ncbi:MAG TPA: arginine N-succinyltransferase [Rhizomicrobium sp.]|nr:arginine N-succinyltransferase [Rhizomicrobium sp.]
MPTRLVRPAAAHDLPQMIALIQSLGSGMTTMPSDATALAAKIERSERSFAGQAKSDLQYVLVLEDDTGLLLGTSAVYPRIGDSHGFFSYKLTRLVQRSKLLERRTDLELLTLNNDYTGATEVGSLAVAPSQRGTGAGRLMARARYMLIAAFPHLFAETVIAEMRGWQDENSHSPFWDAIGARFFDLPFEEADRLSAVEGVGFIAELMPKHPIYTALLPDAARAAIGKPHRESAKAMAMLLAEDFRYDGHVDVFDGGPQLNIARDKIRTVKDSHPARIGKTGPERLAAPLLLTNAMLEHFRVVETEGRVEDGVAILNDQTQRALGVQAGDMVRVAPGQRAPA